MAKKKSISLMEQDIVLGVPEDAVALKVTAFLCRRDRKPQKVSKTFNVHEIYAARKSFLDHVDETYFLTEEGRAYLDRGHGS